MLSELIEYASYMPHGMCLLWQPWLVALHAGSDILIFLSYAAIPLALVGFLRRRPDLRYRGLVGLFAAFILLCGLTHLVSVMTLWVPIYPIQGLLKLATGLVSALTAVVLFRMIPKLVEIPSPSQLSDANAALLSEIEAHKETLRQLRVSQAGLEAQVEARTAELREANERLSVVSREAVHRSHNLLSVVGGIARQTARGAGSVETFIRDFVGRLDALSTASSSFLNDGDSGSADLEVVLRKQLEPTLLTFGDRITLSGPKVLVNADAAQQLGLAIHELATNAQKFGALSGEVGEIKVFWDLESAGSKPAFKLSWIESGIETDAEPENRGSGFGGILLTRVVPAMLQGRGNRDVTPKGLRYVLEVPADAVLPKSDTSTQSLATADELIARTFASPSLG